MTYARNRERPGLMSDWCATYSPTCGICRERRECAREALRKARGGACAEWPSMPSERHEFCASALLDGFTVEEITEAGG